MKKFTTFTNDKKNNVSTDKNMLNNNLIKTESTINFIKKNLLFYDSVVKFPSLFKPSETIKLLESNNIDKNKLHYIIIEQKDNSLLVMKYNSSLNMNINEFVNSLISFYKKNENLEKYFKDININGTYAYSIIKNIPDVKLNENLKLIDIINNDIIKLLRKK